MSYHVAALLRALDDAIFDACKQAGVPACNGRYQADDEQCLIGTVHTRAAQVAQLIADMVSDMGAGAEQAAKMVQLLGDALGEVARPVVKPMEVIAPSGLTVVREPSGKPGELSVVLTGPPLADIQPGLYELEFAGGARYIAAVGRRRGEPWFVRLEDANDAPSMYDLVIYDWSHVAGATLIRTAS